MGDSRKRRSPAFQAVAPVLETASKTSNPSLKTLSKESYNFQYSIQEQKIIEAVENSLEPITPLEVSSITKINHSSVKVLMPKLARNGVIRREYHGHYVSAKNLVTFGSSVVDSYGEFVSPLLHSVRFRFVGLASVSPRRWVVEVGSVVNVSFQVFSNGSAVVFVDCVGDVSLDYPAFCLLVDRVCGELGVSCWDGVSVSSFEFNVDFEGVRLDGVQAVTLRAFDGSFHRLYNKRFGVRDEVKVVGSQKVESVLALMQGGVSTYNVLQLLFANFQEQQKLVELYKFQNRVVSDAVSSMRRLVEKEVSE